MVREGGTMDGSRCLTSRRVFSSLIVVCQVVAVLALSATSAHAGATVDRFFGQQTDTFTAPLEGCLPEDQVGTVILTETSTGQRVDTGAGTVTVHGVNVYDYHLDLPDGRYVQSWLNRDHYTSLDNPPHSVFNVVTQDLRTIYAADGTPVGTLSIHAGYHITYSDLNGIATEFEYFHLRCG